MIALVGYTGFVGSNIYSKGEIDVVYNSKNIESAYGTEPDLLIYSGLRAEKYLANNDPAKDMELINQAIENITKINPKKLVLISTVDVLKNPIDVDETVDIEIDGLQAYGYNRYQLEVWVREHYKDALIVRLPGLFGKNIKKNFIYDFINVIPFMLKEDKYYELVKIEKDIEKYYHKQDNGFYKVDVKEDEKEDLKNIFRRMGFSALNFTDSRSRFQLYNLSRLWNDINIALDNNLTIWHPATEPVTASEIYKYLTGEEFDNELNGAPANYDYKTAYASIFDGANGYICDKETVLKEIKDFVNM